MNGRILTRLTWIDALRLLWTLLALYGLVLIIFGIPLRLEELLTVRTDGYTFVGQLTPYESISLIEMGLSVAIYARYITIIEVIVALTFILMGGVVFWRRSQEWTALLVATMLITLVLVLPLFSVTQRAGFLPSSLLTLGSVAFGLTIISFPILFPDGRPVPRWGMILIVTWLVYGVAGLFNPAILPPIAFGAGLQPNQYLPMVWLIGSFALAVSAQIYRYFYVATALQRQQTKWVVFGLAIWFILTCVGTILIVSGARSDIPELAIITRLVGVTLLLAGSLFIPVSIGFSILRYRLWDIDLIIRRTVVYSLLSAILALIYLSLIILLQSLFRSVAGEQSPLIIVISTLLIAALFTPLRRRIQDVLDRRFYRKKYDAQQVLAQFAQTARDETDMAALQAELLRVVQETMQPEGVSLWLKDSGKVKREI